MKQIIPLCLLLLITSCAGSKIIQLATQGNLSTANFNEEIPFFYFGKYIYINVTINNQAYPFLLDTGWEITHIDQELLKEVDFSPLQQYQTEGSSFEKTKLQYGTLNSTLSIGTIDFDQIGVGIQELSFITSCFPDKRKIYGIIGTNVLRKAFWQIDYKKQVLRYSNSIENFPPKSTALELQMIPRNTTNWGLNKIPVNINGVTDNFVFDTGSYGSFSANPIFLERIERTETTLEEKKTPKSTIRKFAIKQLLVDSIEFSDQVLQIEEGINLLIGNDFLEDFIVTIDWQSNKLYLMKNID